MSKYDDTYEVLVHMAKAKMVMNAHKGSIEDIDTDVLIELAKGELDELKEAINNGDILNIIEEAGDVANFIVAATHRAVHHYRGRNNVKNTRHPESTRHQEVDNNSYGPISESGGAYLQCCDDCESNCKKGELVGRIHNKVCPRARP